MSCQPLSVQTFDDTDIDCEPNSTSSGLEHSLSLGRCYSRCSVLDDLHSSSDAAINLDNAYQQIHALPTCDDKLLMMDVYGKLPFVCYLSA